MTFEILSGFSKLKNYLIVKMNSGTSDIIICPNLRVTLTLGSSPSYLSWDLTPASSGRKDGVGIGEGYQNPFSEWRLPESQEWYGSLRRSCHQELTLTPFTPFTKTCSVGGWGNVS